MPPLGRVETVSQCRSGVRVARSLDLPCVDRMASSRLIALLLAAGAAIVMSTWLRTWTSATPAQSDTADYSSTYVAATMWRQGQGSSLYSPAAQQASGSTLGLSGAQFRGNRFVDPPLAAVAAAPFSLLPLAAAYHAWGALQLLLMVAAVLVAARAAPWRRGRPLLAPAASCALALAGAGTAMLVLQGQWDGFATLGLAVAYACWRNERPFAGGTVLTATALLAKPHLALVLAAWMVGRRDRRMLWGAAAALVAVVLATLALAGPAALAGFVAAPVLSSGVTPVRMVLGFLGLFASWLGDPTAIYVLAAVAGLVACAAGVMLGDRTRRGRMSLEPSLAAAVVLSLLAAPHVLAQDLALLAAPFVWMAAYTTAPVRGAMWPGAGALIVGWAALDLAIRADAGNYAAAPPGRLVPLVLLAGLAVAALGPGALRRARARLPAPA